MNGFMICVLKQSLLGCTANLGCPMELSTRVIRDKQSVNRVIRHETSWKSNGTAKHSLMSAVARTIDVTVSRVDRLSQGYVKLIT
jgi:hypothetical protein